jgi:hypothetical protein
LELSQLYPDDPEVLYHAGRLHGDIAYQSMQRLSQVAPDSVWVHQATGEAHEVQGQYERKPHMNTTGQGDHAGA